MPQPRSLATWSGVDALIRARLDSEVAMVRQGGGIHRGRGGKRLRPALVLLASAACDYRGEARLELAAVVEFIHTATLLHDDVVDDSQCGAAASTANAAFGNAAAVLVGDFPLFTRFPDDGRAGQHARDAGAR
jgi:octaprenyl-diphosphate synthase